MSEKMLLITSDDKIEVIDYNGLESMQKAVNGLIEPAGMVNVIVPSETSPTGEKIINCDAYSNEEFLYLKGDEFDKANALAMMLTDNALIRGNVILVPVNLDEGKNYGFTEAESAIVKQIFDVYRDNHSKPIAKIHKAKDNGKDEPSVQITGA